MNNSQKLLKLHENILERSISINKILPPTKIDQKGVKIIYTAEKLLDFISISVNIFFNLNNNKRWFIDLYNSDNKNIFNDEINIIIKTLMNEIIIKSIEETYNKGNLKQAHVLNEILKKYIDILSILIKTKKHYGGKKKNKQRGGDAISYILINIIEQSIIIIISYIEKILGIWFSDDYRKNISEPIEEFIQKNHINKSSQKRDWWKFWNVDN